MKKLNFEQMEKIEGGFPWWGTYCDYGAIPTRSEFVEVGEVGGGNYEEACYYPCGYYVLGIQTGNRPDSYAPCPPGW